MAHTFSDRAQQVMARAASEAAALQHDYVGTGHMALALLGEAEGAAAAVLEALHVDRVAASERIRSKLKPGKQIKPMAERPYTSRAIRSLEGSMAGANELEDTLVDVEHLLIGLTSVPESLAAEALASYGVTRAVALSQARRLRE
jgi:ATP-dependent Clp protease ATP-binding subunit ClpC